MPRIRKHVGVLCIAALAIAASCSPIISPFSQQAYKYATELKVDSLKLMDLAELPYGENADRIEKLQVQLEKAFEFAKGRPRNEHSARQWEMLIDPEVNLLGGFLKRWKEAGALNYPFISESKKIVSEAFDAVIGLESGKIRTD